ncbi:hypothetical protein G6O69_37775 [Pseudenhygromyxa sp. WMMC2535]|uniref:zinc-dependent metalloprotease family protein n=1 Tax=Pseudenhygromyxa sp. WMMC2535 TaxID=2712867 RepID=UPI0015551DA0|nr:zinc-dependent metalloprotease family protein [Pseudenhygromyxa sp. WMMC2535]NVB37223.1 hypothetical protein [Pseudenhygromyxa sp. WMMC2535]NVB43621.1 hypothetical protein [Pseudenhygromyxa sp. WMMC2535]
MSIDEGGDEAEGLGSEAEGLGSEDTAPEGGLVEALGISITEVEANQGTRVAIGGPDGAWLSTTDRSVPLIGDRDTLIRVHFEVAEGWEPHNVTARLHVYPASGDEATVHEQQLLVEEDSSPTAFSRTFYFGLFASTGETAPGTRYQVELVEYDVDQPVDLPAMSAVNPATGPEPIGFESTPMELDIVLVPIAYYGAEEGGVRLPDLSQDNVDRLIDRLFEHNPLQKINYEIRAEPVVYAPFLEELGSLLPIMAATKQSDDAADNVYYHALIDTGCAIEGCLGGGAAGIAMLAGATRDESFARVAATIWNDADLDATADTFVHEVGHNQGLGHVACASGSPDYTDPTYPHSQGKIGNWGYGIRSFSLHNPTVSYDYMSYCRRTWVSDWTFNKTYERIQTLTSWNNESSSSDGEPGVPGSQVLIAALYPSGAEDWFVVDGGVPVDTLDASERVDFEVGGLTIEQPTAVHTLSDDETVWIVAPMPERVGFEQIDSITHVRAGLPRRVLSPSEVRVAGLRVQNP